MAALGDQPFEIDDQGRQTNERARKPAVVGLPPPPPSPAKAREEPEDLACTAPLGSIDSYLVLLLSTPLAWASTLAALLSPAPEPPLRAERRDYQRMDSRVDSSLCFVRLRDRPDWVAAAASWSRAAHESETSRRAKLRRELRDPTREHVIAQRKLSGEPVGMGALEMPRNGGEPEAAIFLGNTERFDTAGRNRVEQALAAYLSDVARSRGATRMLVATTRYKYIFDLASTGYKYRRFVEPAPSEDADACATEPRSRAVASTVVRSAASHVFRAASAAAFLLSRRTKPACAPEPKLVKVWL